MTAHPAPIASFTVDQLVVNVYETRDEMGAGAAWDVSSRMRSLLGSQKHTSLVFAAAPSQNEFLSALGSAPELDWHRVEAFHMDEYVGLDRAAPQSFGHFLREALFDRVHPGRVEYIEGTAADIQAECERYAALLCERPIDIVCAGIGENGHLAFNDPHVADFADVEIVKQVSLDETCRLQQVHDGAFPTVGAVPKTALTMTMSALLSTRWIYCVVPGPSKAKAVLETLRGPISTSCPASALRRHQAAVLYIDRDAAASL